MVPACTASDAGAGCGSGDGDDAATSHMGLALPSPSSIPVRLKVPKGTRSCARGRCLAPGGGRESSSARLRGAKREFLVSAHPCWQKCWFPSPRGLDRPAHPSVPCPTTQKGVAGGHHPGLELAEESQRVRVDISHFSSNSWRASVSALRPCPGLAPGRAGTKILSSVKQVPFWLWTSFIFFQFVLKWGWWWCW